MTAGIVCLFFFLCAEGLFSGMETGLVSVRRPRAEHAAAKGNRCAVLLLFFLNRPGLMISTTLLGVNICVVGSSLAAKSIAEKAGWSSPGALLAVSSVLSVVMLMCEIIPKNWFRQSPFRRCSGFIPILYGTYWLLFIPARFFDRLTSFLTRLISGKRDATLETARMRTDLSLYFRESESEGVLPAGASEYLDHAAALHELSVENFMIPARSVFTVPESATVAEAAVLCREHRVLLLPIRSDASPDEWLGVFSFYKAFFAFPESEWKIRKVSEASAKAAAFPPETPVLEALAKARFSGNPMFYVRREGKILGMFTVLSVARKIFTPGSL